MKIPKTLKFLGHSVKIKQVSVGKIEKEGFGYGFYNFDKATISIDKDLSQIQKGQVLFHEIGEMLAYYLDMEYQEVSRHIGFKRYIDIFWGILKENKLIR